MNRSHQVSDASVPNAAWKALFLAGAIAALVAVLFFRRNCGAELTQFNGIGLFNVPETPPTTALELFSLLQKDRFVGLALLDLFDLVNYALVGLIFLALYGPLRHVHKSAMVVATSFGLVGIAVYFASNQAFSMLSLSDRYAFVFGQFTIGYFFNDFLLAYMGINVILIRGFLLLSVLSAFAHDVQEKDK